MKKEEREAARNPPDGERKPHTSVHWLDGSAQSEHNTPLLSGHQPRQGKGSPHKDPPLFPPQWGSGWEGGRFLFFL